MYRWRLRILALSAAVLTAVAQLMIMVLDKMLTQVTSHISILLCLKGNSVMLSGQRHSP